MKISVSQQITNGNGKSHDRPNDPQIKKTFMKFLNKRGAVENSDYHWIDDETVDAKSISPVDLHSFLLYAEALGKSVSYTKQTIITIK